MSQDSSNYYDLAKVYEITGLTYKKAKKLIKLKHFPRYLVFGKFVCWKKDEIDKWMDGEFHW